MNKPDFELTPTNYRLEWKEGHPELRMYEGDKRSNAFIRVEYRNGFDVYRVLRMNDKDRAKLRTWFLKEDQKLF